MLDMLILSLKMMAGSSFRIGEKPGILSICPLVTYAKSMVSELRVFSQNPGMALHRRH